MLRTQHQIPWGDTLIGHCLQAAGLRHRQPRTPVEAPWSAGTWHTLFPGVQWLGDGTTVAFWWQGQCWPFNVEAVLDPASNAWLGFHVSEAEDEAAVGEAFAASVATAGASPLALTLDNRPSNHTPGVAAALADTMLLRATPGRGQAKAALEGAFGLFQQALPPLVVTATTPRAQARQVLTLLLTAWARGRNGRPRRKLNGRTPAEAYADTKPTTEQIEEAKRWLAELLRRAALAQQTRTARQDPVRLALLQEGLTQLGIADPACRLARSLAGYAREAIVRGLATFQAKQDLGTVPAGAEPGRYLGGIVRQLHTKLELEHTSRHLLAQRLRMRDLSLAPLQAEAQQIRLKIPLAEQPSHLVDRALAAAAAAAPTASLAFRFWANEAHHALKALPPAQRAGLYPQLCRRIAGCFGADRARRADLIDGLAAAVAA